MLQEEHTLITYKPCVFTIKPFSGEILYSFLFLSSSLSAFFSPSLPVSLLVSSLLSFHPLSISSLCFSLLPPSSQVGFGKGTPSKTLWVDGINPNMGEPHLERHMSKFGRVCVHLYVLPCM